MAKDPPDWAEQPFRRFLDYITEAEHILLLAQFPSALVETMPSIFDILLVPDDPDPQHAVSEAHRKALKLLRQLAGRARAEAGRDFALLHSHWLVSAWAALEAYVKDLLLAWLLNRPEVLGRDPIAKIRISVGEFHILDREARMVRLAYELEQSVGAGLSPGVGRFEKLLDAVDLSGPVEPDVKRDLYEMSQVRNVLAHRAGVADPRFVAACGTLDRWKDLGAGERLQISSDDHRRYRTATIVYALRVADRVRSHLGCDPHDLDEALGAAVQSAQQE